MSKSKRTALFIFIPVVLIVAVFSYFLIQINDNLDSLVEIPIQDIDLSSIEDGKYIGEYEAFPVSVTLEVEVQNHEIVNIIILKHENGQGESAETIIDDVISQQSIEVDSVSGATYSSKVILLAIKNALD